MAEDPGLFSVDPDELERGGVHIRQMADIAMKVYDRLTEVEAKYPKLGGDGSVGKSFEVNYYPVMKECTKLVTDLAKLLADAGGRTGDLGRLFADVNSEATRVATGRSS
ncbi:hypothetical protein [Actinoallomurus sp. NPDC050550]|uniref:hypothetical protein n=1 Tax=Actinoallomurus sp. NPDC050550 TaxID=3154937 RepID=UPI0033DB4778